MPKITYPFQPSILDALPEPIAELYRGLELKLLDEICSRLRVSDQLNEVTVDAIRALRSHGIPLDQIKKAIRDTEQLTQKKLDALLDDVVARNEKYYGELCTLADVTQPPAMVDARDIDAIKSQCQREFANITRSMGFLVDNGRTLLPPAKAYQKCLGIATTAIESGAVSYNKAIADAVQELAKSGLCVFTDAKGEHRNMVLYESGHRDQIDVAARRAILSGVNRLNQRYREQSMDYLETDLLEVSAHTGARDTGEGYQNHKSWQGKIYRWKQKPRTSTGNYPDFEDTCAPGDVQGIGGANCRHSYWPYIEGVMTPTYTQAELDNIDPPPFEFEGKTYSIYEATQKQRAIEREIRKQKRIKLAAQGTENEAAAGARLTVLNQKYRNFSKAAGLPTQLERIRVLYK